jgi:hypothetical protein
LWRHGGQLTSSWQGCWAKWLRLGSLKIVWHLIITLEGHPRQCRSGLVLEDWGWIPTNKIETRLGLAKRPEPVRRSVALRLGNTIRKLHRLNRSLLGLLN